LRHFRAKVSLISKLIQQIKVIAVSKEDISRKRMNRKG